MNISTILQNKKMAGLAVTGITLGSGLLIGFSWGRYGNIAIPYLAAEDKLIKNALREPSISNTQRVSQHVKESKSDYYHMIKNLDHLSRPVIPVEVLGESYNVVIGTKANHLVHTDDLNLQHKICKEKLLADQSKSNSDGIKTIDFMKIISDIKRENPHWTDTTWKQYFAKQIEKKGLPEPDRNYIYSRSSR
jgi:hypothetical protein